MGLDPDHDSMGLDPDQNSMGLDPDPDSMRMDLQYCDNESVNVYS
jgi:hypothetical protein